MTVIETHSARWFQRDRENATLRWTSVRYEHNKLCLNSVGAELSRRRVEKIGSKWRLASFKNIKISTQPGDDQRLRALRKKKKRRRKRRGGRRRKNQSGAPGVSIPPIPQTKQRLYCVNQPRLPVVPARPHPRLTLAGQCGYPFILAKTKSPALYSRGRGRAMSLNIKRGLRWLYNPEQFSPGPSVQG